MGAIGVLRTREGGCLAFYCPGCDEMHNVRVQGEGRPLWKWNGSYDKPTFTPSVLVTNGHYASHHKQGDPCWCTYNRENPDNPSKFTCQRCHLFVTDGKIRYLNDCTHQYADQTIPLTLPLEHQDGEPQS